MGENRENGIFLQVYIQARLANSQISTKQADISPATLVVTYILLMLTLLRKIFPLWSDRQRIVLAGSFSLLFLFFGVLAYHPEYLATILPKENDAISQGLFFMSCAIFGLFVSKLTTYIVSFFHVRAEMKKNKKKKQLSILYFLIFFV